MPVEDPLSQRFEGLVAQVPCTVEPGSGRAGDDDSVVASDAILVPVIPTTLSQRTFEQLLGWLQQHPQVRWVNYAGLKDSPYRDNCKKYCNGKAAGILSFGIEGGFEAGGRFIDALQLILRLVNIGDAKSLACHPASTTHRQLGPDELASAGVSEDMVRLSIGIEHIDDIIADIEQALAAV